MRLRLLLCIMALVLLCGARRGRPGRLLVRSSTLGAVIEVDGEPIGAVPMTLPFVLRSGTHALRVHLPGHADFVDDVRIRSGRDTVLDVELLALRAVVAVDADVPGARVVVGGRLVGLTPYEGELKPGETQLVVHAAGRAPYRERVRLEAGQPLRRRVTLVPLPDAVGAASGAPWYREWWVWATAGAVVAGVVTTAVVLSADDGGAAAPPRHTLTFEPVR